MQPVPGRCDWRSRAPSVDRCPVPRGSERPGTYPESEVAPVESLPVPEVSHRQHERFSPAFTVISSASGGDLVTDGPAPEHDGGRRAGRGREHQRALASEPSVTESVNFTGSPGCARRDELPQPEGDVQVPGLRLAHRQGVVDDPARRRPATRSR